jgi:hypothetical protein
MEQYNIGEPKLNAVGELRNPQSANLMCSVDTVQDCKYLVPIVFIMVHPYTDPKLAFLRITN